MAGAGTAMRALRAVLLSVLGLAGASAPTHAETAVIRLGMTRSNANAAELMAIRNGYFKDAGIKLDWRQVDTATNVIELLARGGYQIVAGGISARFFEAVEKNMPITIVGDRVSSPVGHNLMLRPDLQEEIRSPKDLKGRVIATNGKGSVSNYEVGKILERHGLTLADVEVKHVPFAQMSAAFASKSIDAGILIPPYVYQLEDQKIAVPFASVDEAVEPRPMTVAVVMVNTNWAKQNPELVQSYVQAWLRGVRDYCSGYRGAPVRIEIVDELVKAGTEKQPELLHKYPWPARSPDGRVNVASLLDIQNWYARNKLIAAELPAERLVDTSYIEAAVQKLGPFEPPNPESKLPGCR